MFCPSCGQENLDEARFCGACGSPSAATAEATLSSPSEAPTASAGTAPAAGEKSLWQKEIFTYWAYRGLALVIALLTGVILIGSYLFGLLLTVLGACLWVGVTGKQPGTHLRVNPVVRAVLGLIPIAANGFVASVAGYFAACRSADIFCGGLGPAAGAGIGLGVFVGAAAIEALAILLYVGAVKLIRLLWRQAAPTCDMGLRGGE